MISVNELRHPKEKLYRLMCMVIGGLIWAGLLLGTMLSILLMLLPVALVLWVAGRFFRATLYGNSVQVNQQQYAELNAMVQDVGRQLGLGRIPETFVVNAGGLTNALAVKFLSTQYVLMFSSLVDLLWDEKNNDRVRMIVAHELAHHAAGHVNFWINLLMKPAMFVPFLGAAYSRSCELTADRIAAASIPANREAAVTAMITLASGSQVLTPHTSVEAFKRQEQQIPKVFGFLQEILSSHPRMTKRILAIEAYYDARPVQSVAAQAA
ncbi:Zn-dependent protease with chaperone function [Marinobacterium halophilum]|uniref:Zn-dependent protease with chaperone function n=1 Tax=Marinobacterium halophilum TaxID=267374 RepID=A0A2P8F1Y7_9GAMM|nr:M48 family metallopeptidase [Marinobacterium halophilum]PSL15735.1 Zn-dependent protease with chaperone function [Marinobacterium halophilum]